MLTIPINANTFKRSFLGGDGSFVISTDQDTWKTLFENGGTFDEDVQDLVDLKFSAATTRPFKFGQAGRLTLDVALSAEAAARVDLIWPKDDSEAIRKYKLQQYLTDGRLYMAVSFNARAGAEARGTFPAGPLSLTFGASAGGYVGYERLVPFSRTTTVREILTELFGGVRLPQSVNTPAEMPAEGEVLVTSYGGYLKLSAGLNWGYSLTGTRSFEARDLKLGLDYALRVLAGVQLGYQVAGDYNFETRRGADPGWIRYRVTKKRRSEFNFAADFGFTAKLNPDDVNGLPETADEFLAALFGADARTALGYLAKAEKYSSLEELEKAAGKFARDFLQGLSDRLIGRALDDGTLKEFLAAVKKVTDAYGSLDQRILDLYRDYLDKVPQLNATLDRILAVTTVEGLKALTTGEAWDVVRRLSGDRFYDLLLSNEELQQFRDYVGRVKSFVNDGAAKEVRDFIAALKEKFPLDDLFKELEKYDTPEELRALADEKLQALVEKLLGKAFDQLGDFREASKQVNAAVRQVSKFKDKWYEKATEALHQTFEFNLHYAYTRANEEDALVDVEVNVAGAEGQRLAAAASVGDFAELMATYDPTLVRLNPDTVFTRKLTKAAQLQVNVFGWSYERLTELLQNTEHAIQTEQGGLMHVFTIETQIRQLTETRSRKKLVESVQSNFLLRAVGESFQSVGGGLPQDPATGRYVIRTLTNMSAQYRMLTRDDRTSARELTHYLDLAAHLGLLPDSRAFVDELDGQFPRGLGKVTVDYVVRYDDQTVRNAFTLSGEALAAWARDTARKLQAAKLTGMKGTDWAARVGFAYVTPAFYKLFKEGNLKNSGTRLVALPPWFTGGGEHMVVLSPAHLQTLDTFFRVEKRYAERLVALDALVDRSVQHKEPIPVEDLQKAVSDFVGMADDLDGIGGENSFFAMFDKLVQEGSSGKWRRESAVVLRIEPPEGEPVVKYLMG